MDTDPLIRLILLIIMLCLSAFFSSAETAFTTVNRIQIQMLADEGSKRANRTLWIIDHSAKMLSAIHIGNNIVNIAASSLTTTLTIRVFGNPYVGAAAGILTLVVLIFGEITPKSIAQARSLKMCLSYAPAIYAIMTVLTPVIFIIEGIRRGLCRIMRVDPDAKPASMTEDELKTLVDVGFEEGAIEDDEFEMISNIFDLDESLARDIMIPRADMVFVPADADYEELMDIYREYNYTRYPVYADSTNNVIGTINMKDLLLYERDENFTVREILREPHFTFEHKEIGTLLMEMREASLNIVIVLDEYGVTAGMITLEDILEEIVGEIRDEYDKDETDAVIPLKNGKEFLIDGATNLDDVNDETGLELESEQYDSIGGFIIEFLDRLPKKGEVIELEDGTRIISEVVRNNRIEKVHIKLPDGKPGEK